MNKYLSLGSENESHLFPELKDVNIIDSGIHSEHSPIEFGLVQYKTEPWLTSSIDGYVVLQVDGRSKEA